MAPIDNFACSIDVAAVMARPRPSRILRVMIIVASPVGVMVISTVRTDLAFLPHTASSNAVDNGVSSGADFHVPASAGAVVADTDGARVRIASNARIAGI